MSHVATDSLGSDVGVLCPNNHSISPTAAFCDQCGLPVVKKERRAPIDPDGDLYSLAYAEAPTTNGAPIRSKRRFVVALLIAIAVGAAIVGAFLTLNTPPTHKSPLVSWGVENGQLVKYVAGDAYQVKQDFTRGNLSEVTTNDCASMRAAVEDDAPPYMPNVPSSKPEASWQSMRSSLLTAANECLDEIPSGSLGNDVAQNVRVGLLAYAQLTRQIPSIRTAS
jgi:hypothetical protein